MACLNPDPARRITAEAALRFHPFLTRAAGADSEHASVPFEGKTMVLRAGGAAVSSDAYADGVFDDGGEVGAADFKAAMAVEGENTGGASFSWVGDDATAAALLRATELVVPPFGDDADAGSERDVDADDANDASGGRQSSLMSSSV